jgi:RTX calcium-binding nonapeptide repeat (4 copies)
MGATSLLDQAKGGKMRKVTLMLAAVAMMVSLFAVAAYAAEITGTSEDDNLNESQGNDKIAGHAGFDDLDADVYNINETPGGNGDTDEVKGNLGDDFIDAEDGDGRDTVNGGRGVDECQADSGDDVTNCEL